MSVLIRDSKIEDAEAIARVHTLSWQTSYKGIMPQDFLDSLSIEKRTERRREILTTGRMIALVAERENQIIGFCDAGEAREENDGAQSELYAIYLLEEHKGQGAGTLLFEEATRRLKARGFKDMVLWALDANDRAGKFYEKMGGKLHTRKTMDIGGRELPKVSYYFTL